MVSWISLLHAFFSAQQHLRKHIASKHEHDTNFNCNRCEITFESNQELRRHLEESCDGEFQTIRNKMCRYFLNGECWRQDKCKFLHDGAKKIEKESIPLCKNGVNCSFLARGICNFSHRKVGVQNKRIFINLNKPSPPPARNFPQNNNHDSRPWCKFLEDCIRAPHCNFKHYDEVFPKLPKTNNPPWYKSQSMLEEY